MNLTPDLLSIQPESVSQKLEEFIGNSIVNFKRDGVVVGLSGGLDSSVVFSLCVRAVSSSKVLALIMPERDSQRVLELVGIDGSTALLGNQRGAPRL